MSLARSNTIPVKQKINRNDPCYCGSGKKYKKCHYLNEQTQYAYSPEIKTKFFRKISEFLVPQKFFADLMNTATIDIFSKQSYRKRKDGKYELNESEMGTLADAIIFEGIYQGDSPLAFFCHHAPLSESERKLYQEWLKKTRFSIFEVKEVTLGKSLHLFDLVTKEQLVVYEKLGTHSLHSGDGITGRILPFAEAWMFSSGTNIKIPPDIFSEFKSKTAAIKPGDIKQLDVFRFFHVGIHDIENPLLSKKI